ncbi:asparaginase [Pelagirhabdus alkalitolerans]|uniref:asparaginase n=1 Tax=Pelagirhabdus alkalitolerans TaxID=1612202 RepID=A0A1G6HB17_9BACI|nr:asparaginase [Pelagirhabdus alkalitolerans]SDB91497.1 asparaginase [Pelagirhabdus alkalitolerans]
MKKIMIIHTGGTIAMEDHAEEGTIMTKDKHPLTQHLNHLQTFASISEHYLLDLPSPQMTPKEMLRIGQTIQELVEAGLYDGVVITHGTDTLEETAYFLDLYLNNDIPVVLTGAMRSSNEIGSDGLYNLISSIRVASDPDSKHKGVLVVMNDDIHTAPVVTKTSTSNVATFQSPQFGPIGMITKEDIYYYQTRLTFEHISFDHVSKVVPLLKVYAGMEPSFISAVMAAEIDGLVIEAFGQGNVPIALADQIDQLIERDIPVVIVSRSFKGNVQPTYAYVGGGKQLKDKGVFFEKRLSGPKARIRLLALLASGCDRTALKQKLCP